MALSTSVLQAILSSAPGQHKQGFVEGFTKEYKVDLLVYYEFHDDMLGAITREKQMKKWNRAWKINLIEERNPDWRDLSTDL